MSSLKKHIIFKIAGLVLVLALILPFGIKLTHAFNHHKHEVCNGESTAHLHKTDFDCKFYKFQLNRTFTLFSFDFVPFIQVETSKIVIELYFFKYNHQQLPFSLRAPPVYLT